MSQPQQHRKGTTAYYVVTLNPSLEGEELPYTNETIVTELWAGNAGAALATLTTTWFDPPNKIRVRVTDANVENLDTGNYQIVSTIGGEEVATWELELVDGPTDDADELTTYASIGDCRLFADWIDSYVAGKFSRAALELQRAHARKSFDAWVVSFARTLMDELVLVLNEDEEAIDRTELTKAVLQARLDDNKLTITQEIKDWNALHALWLALQHQHGEVNGSTATKLAMQFRQHRDRIGMGLSITLADRDGDDADGNGTLVFDITNLG